MPGMSRKFLLGLFLLLAGGTAIGWIYGEPERGLLVAALAALAWQVRHLLAFLRALYTNDFDAFRYGEGVWQQIFSRFFYEREKANRRKQQYRELLREVRKSTDAMPDGAVILGSNNEIVMCNRAAKELVGLKRKKDRGQRVDNILRDPALNRLLNSDGFGESVEIGSPLRDGDWLNCRVVPYGADQKLLFIRDVTERRRLSKMRRDFVGNASHELRSPLTVISGYLESMSDDAAISAEWEQPIAQMRAQAQRMNHIVAELLELSRLESSGQAATDEVVDVCGLLAAARKGYAQDADVEIELDLASTAQIRGSSSEIESVINNLLANAIRHTRGDRKIGLSWRSDPDGAYLCVRDNGEGIAQEHLPRLTERFFRVDRGRAREDGGVGLGLAIVKHVLGRHDAELGIVSELNVGSEFCCYFPAERVVIEPPVPLANS